MIKKAWNKGLTKETDAGIAKYSHLHSDETKKKIGIANKGKEPWNKNKVLVDVDCVECVYLYCVKNFSIDNIANRFECYSGTVRKRLISCGVSIKNPKDRINTVKGKFHKKVDKEKILDLYINQGYAAVEIAKIFHCDSSVIWHRLRYMNVKIRGSKEAANMERRIIKHKQHERGGWKLPPRSKEQCENLRQKAIERWKNPKLREKMLAGSRKGLERTRLEPTRFEKQIIEIVPSNAKFTGNGKFWIPIKNGKYKNRNPDFIVKPFKKTKKVIEVLGGYYHDPIFTKELWWDHHQRILDEYKSAGVECFIIWYFNWKDIFLRDIDIQKLKEFCNGD